MQVRNLKHRVRPVKYRTIRWLAFRLDHNVVTLTGRYMGTIRMFSAIVQLNKDA